MCRTWRAHGRGPMGCSPRARRVSVSGELSVPVTAGPTESHRTKSCTVSLDFFGRFENKIFWIKFAPARSLNLEKPNILSYNLYTVKCNHFKRTA